MARRQTSSNSVTPQARAWGWPVVCGCLGLATVMSALGVVQSTFATRQATQQLEQLRRDAGEMQVRAGKYLLEKSTLAAYTRVEREAEAHLDMVVPSAENLEMVRR